MEGGQIARNAPYSDGNSSYRTDKFFSSSSDWPVSDWMLMVSVARGLDGGSRCRRSKVVMVVILDLIGLLMVVLNFLAVMGSYSVGWGVRTLLDVLSWFDSI